jgi:hypothetical protein
MSDEADIAQDTQERVLRVAPVPVLEALDPVDLLEKNLGRQIEAIRASDIKIASSCRR